MPFPILVGVDPSRGSAEQIALGAILARTYQARLILVSVYLDNPMTSSRSMRRAARDEAEAALHVAADAVGDLDRVEVRAQGARSPAGGLYYVAVETRARMLAVGSTHRGSVGRVVLGAVTDNLVNGAPCAVAVAPQDVEIRSLERIGVAFEDTAEGYAALDEAALLAAETAGELQAWTVVTPGEEVDERKRRAESALVHALGRAGADAAQAHVVDGEALAVLTDASAQLDVLVCGSRGYGPTRAVLLGSVSRDLANQAQCALMIVPHAVTIRD